MPETIEKQDAYAASVRRRDMVSKAYAYVVSSVRLCSEAKRQLEGLRDGEFTGCVEQLDKALGALLTVKGSLWAMERGRHE